MVVLKTHTYPGFICRWVLQLDSAGSVFYSTAPRWVRSSICQNKSSHIFGESNHFFAMRIGKKDNVLTKILIQTVPPICKVHVETSQFYNLLHEHLRYITHSSPFCVGTNNWCDHWKQCVWFIDGAGVPALKDKYLSLKATHNETSISYTMMVEKQTSCNHSSLGDHLLVLPPEKVALYGDKDWRLVLSKAVKEAVSICFIFCYHLRSSQELIL